MLRQLITRCGSLNSVGMLLLLQLSDVCGLQSALAQGLPITEPPPGTKVEYTAIAKILRQNCLACHSGTTIEAGLNLETPQLMFKGGDSGPALIAKKPAESPLFRLAAHLDDPVMPPKNNKVNAKPLTAGELGLLKRWIEAGAEGAPLTNAAPVTWQPLPTAVNPVLATAVTADGLLAAAGRGNEILMLEPTGGRFLGKLVDPNLNNHAGPRGAVAHTDLVQSLAFDPSGEWLASGGFREIKLWRRPRNPKLAELPPVPSPVKAAAVSPDNKIAAFGTEDGRVLLVELAVKQVKQTITAHQGPVNGLVVSTDGGLIFSAGEDKQLRAWRMTDGGEAGKIETTTAIRGLALVADGKQLITAQSDNLARIWATETVTASTAGAKPLSEFNGHESPLVGVVGHVAQKFVITADQSHTVRIWNLDNRQQKFEYSHSAAVTGLVLSTDGKAVASSAADGTIKLSTLPEGKQIAEIRGDARARFSVSQLERAHKLSQAKLEERKKEVAEAEALAKQEADAIPKIKESLASVEKSLQEKQAAKQKVDADYAAAEEVLTESIEKLTLAQNGVTAAKNAVEQAGDAEPTKQQELKKQLKESEAALKMNEMSVAAAKKKLADTMQAIKKPQEELQSAELSAQSTKRAVEAAEHSAKNAAMQIERAKQAVTAAESAVTAANAALETGKSTVEHSIKPVTAIAFSQDSMLLYTAGQDGLLQSWSTDTGAPRGTVLVGIEPVTTLSVLPDGLLTAHAAKSPVVWSTSSQWKLERIIGKPDDPAILVDRVTALEFSPDGKMLVSGGGEPSRGGEIKIWNPADGGLIRELSDPHSDTVNAVRFSPDGSLLASGAADRFVKVFLVADGGLQKSFEGHTHHVLAVAWRSDGRILCSGSADNTIKVWDLRTGEQRRTILGFGKEITSINYLADTPRVVAGCGDANLRITNTDSGGNERSLTGSGDYVYTAATGADGKIVIAGGQDGVLRIWDPTKSEPLKVIKTP